VNVITVGESGGVFYSNNSATNWYTGSSGTTADIFCVTHSVAGDSNLKAMAGGSSGYLARTTNGGKTWTSMSVFSSLVTIKFHSISMLTNDTAYVAGNNGAVFMTTNFGSSWTRIASTGVTLYSLAVYDSLTAVAGAASGSGIYVMVPGKYFFKCC
jgi:photosystem II stability/assembly factor-like uncharacterized protein